MDASKGKSAKVHPKQLVLSAAARRDLENTLGGAGWLIYRDKSHQAQLFNDVDEILDITRRRISSPSYQSTVHLERIAKELRQIQRELAKLPQWQRARLDLGTRHAAEKSGYARSKSIHGPNSIPRSLLDRVGVGVDGALSDWFIDPFQEECGLIASAADELTAVYADLQKRRSHASSLPPEIQDMIGLLSHAWWRAYRKKPSKKSNGAFGSFINSLLSSLGIEQIGDSQLRRILQAQKVSD
jgi:hypothetical protein